MQTHSDYLRHALKLAEQRRGFCAPNPAVGAVVIKNQVLLAEGFHWQAGHPHAEVEALEKLTPEQSAGAMVYVTLEPCCHYGRTSPCVELLIKRKVKAVYYGFKDPNPIVSGQGEARLKAAGIECNYVFLPEITAFYQSYLHWTQLKRPWVTAKLALSLDGKIAGQNSQRISITGPELQIYTHEWRKRSDAILTTVKTIIQDDPYLNVRLENQIYLKPIYILDSHLHLPHTINLFKSATSLTVFHRVDADSSRKESLEALGVRCVPLPIKYGKLCLHTALEKIGEDGIHDLWVEAGGTCFQAFMLEKLVQRAFIYVAPKWLGEDAQQAFMTNMDVLSTASKVMWRVVGNDVVCELTWDHLLLRTTTHHCEPPSRHCERSEAIQTLNVE